MFGLHIVYMLEVIEELQENTEILRHTEGFVCYASKGNTDETHTPKQQLLQFLTVIQER